MKKIIVSMFPYSSACYTTGSSIGEVRLLYQNTETVEKSLKELICLLLPYHEKNNSLSLCYDKCVTIVLARHMINPFTKLAYFKKEKVCFKEFLWRIKETLSCV